MTDEVAGDDGHVATRKEEIEALPMFHEVTGLQPVEAGMTMYLVPLRSGEARETYFDETANAAGIGDKTQKLIEFVDKRVSEALHGTDLATLSVDGRVDVVALRNTSFKNQRCGVYKMRVLEAAAEGVGKALASDCAVTYAYGATYSHQVIVPDNFYPGAVVEQIAVQNNGLAASFRRDFSIGKNAYVYSVDLDLARQTEITKRG